MRADLTLERRVANFINLGITDYLETYNLQKVLAEKRLKDEIPDTILITEHYPVINFGMIELYNTFSDKLYSQLDKTAQTKKDAIQFLEKKGIPFTQTQRGGGATYIGPGQLNIYPIIDYELLTNQTLGVNKYKDIINELMNNVLHSFGVNSKIDDQNLIRRGEKINDERAKSGDRKDIWITINNMNYKLGGRGIHTKGKVAYHGFNFYVKKNSTSGFEYVNACGYTHDELKTINVEDALGQKIDMTLFTNKILEEIKKQFKYDELNESSIYNSSITSKF